ncbi:zinc-ribbon domain-containing protein [Lachnospiraceae bacterium ZAX-1]
MAQFSGKTEKENEMTAVQKAVADLQERKKLLQNGATRELDAISIQVEDQYKEMGAEIYQLSIRDEKIPDEVNGYIDKINALNKEGDNKKAKLKELLDRCDDEIRMIMPAETKRYATIVSGDVCPSCGASYVKGTDTFCMHCGTKLPTKGGDSPVVVATGAICPLCSTPYVKDVDSFCMHCGTNLR